MATEHKHGTMGITQQQKTFTGFVKFATGVSIAAIVVLIFMALANS
ncbi:aa3-type cytochrome c oxidase subunit IV [Paracoccus sp. (in: a-proteobacteria)]